ncbi:uncharacterized protein LOC118821038 [Colossoma macropomum]|uniref:uncharacterized protein LOC118821038 n=1 Tax=Colossoma macropomum TaxID=42526 RepID=UPI001864E28B|nr:uncharacterized protein LOC118821038 [Colossoma macropomum]
MKMLVIFGILLMFTEAGMGLLFMNPDCRFNQSDPCYGAVGRPLYLQLPSEDELQLLKNMSGSPPDHIFRLRNQKITQNFSDYPSWQFVTNNSIMIISSAEKRDSGRYILEIFDSAGRDRGIYHLQLVIEDVVSSVTVTDNCFSIENRTVSCSSDGENVHYSWTFQHTHQLIDGNQTLLLDKEAVGNVTCYAQNHVSREHKTIELQQCPDPTTVTPTTTPKSKMTQMTQSSKGITLGVSDKEAQTPTHNHTSNPQVPLSFQNPTTVTPTTTPMSKMTQRMQSSKDPTTVTPTTTPMSKMTQRMQSSKGKTLEVTDKEAQTPTHNHTSNPQVPLSFQNPTTVTPTTTPMSKMTQRMQSSKGKTLEVTDKEAQTPTHNHTFNPQVPLSFQSK